MKHHKIRDEMTMASEAIARTWALSIEDRERYRTGLSLPDARKAVARRIGVAPGTLENLRKGRVKRVALHVYQRLRAAVIRELQSEISRCTHELEMARQIGTDPRSADMAALETAMARAKELMGERE